MLDPQNKNQPIAGQPGPSPAHQNIIGVFDSGLGGLSILKYFLKQLPNYNYLYLGDRARVPYGEKSPNTIYTCTREAVDYLFTAGCRLIIIACNTASAQALRRLQQEDLPIAWPGLRLLGVIRPLAEYIAARSMNIQTKLTAPSHQFLNLDNYPDKNKKKRIVKRVGIIGTKATIRSGAYYTELMKLNPRLEIIEASTPLLVPLIEEFWTKKPETKMILKKYLRPFKEKSVDLLLPACTHYSWLLPDIKRVMGPNIEVPDPGAIIATSLHDYLKRHLELDLQPSAKATRRYKLTAADTNFSKLATVFLGQSLDDLEIIQLPSLHSNNNFKTT